MKIALVYDRVNKFGGAERVMLALHKIWPEAPLYTAVYNPEKACWSRGIKVIPSFINSVPLAKFHHEFFPWLMPFAFENFNFNDFDVVLSISSAEAKGIITQPDTLHLCYCLTPTRYLWSNYQHYLNNPRYGIFNPMIRPFLKPGMQKLKAWDQVACKRPDIYLAISKTVQRRIKNYYKRDSQIIYPPVDINMFKSLKLNSIKSLRDRKNYFLVVSRLVSYKRIDLIVEAFNQLGLPLVIIGEGSEKNLLQKKAKANIRFLDRQLTDQELVSYYQNCQALVFAGVEDFGLVALEAQACGKPVIAYKIGGIGEIVINGKTGILFYSQTVEAIKAALIKFRSVKFSSLDCRENAARFSEENFIHKIKKIVEDQWKQRLR